VLVAHACNPRYSGGRDQDDQGSNSAQANSLEIPPSQINLSQKKGERAGVVAQGVGPEFKPQYCKK
jgi:hypothetical protein